MAITQGTTPQWTDINNLVRTLQGITYSGNMGPVMQISSQVITSTTASVTFSNIPSNLSVLFVTWQARSDTAAGNAPLFMRVNGNATANYYGQVIEGANTSLIVGASTAQTAAAIADIAAATATATSMTGMGHAVITGWANSSNALSLVANSLIMQSVTAGGIFSEFQSWAYNVTGTAHTSLTFTTTGNFAGTVGSGCIFTLYGSV